MSKYVVILNRGAIERRQVPNETIEFEGTREDLMEILDGNGVDCTIDDNDELYDFDTWKEEYEENADLSGSTMVATIVEDGIVILEGEDDE